MAKDPLLPLALATGADAGARAGPDIPPPVGGGDPSASAPPVTLALPSGAVEEPTGDRDRDLPSSGTRGAVPSPPVSPALSSLKLCDLKPAWPALFPEISARHSWVGFADIDMILGDLDAELATLQESDELLVPAAMYPHPLANGNFLLFRSTGKMLRVFERIPGWRKALSSRRYAVLDEWWGQTPSLADVLYEMMLNGSLVVRPTR